MGLGGIGIWQLLIILVIIMMLFGTKRLRSIGTDLGGAIKGFRKSMNSEEDQKLEQKDQDTSTTIDAKAETVDQDKK